MANPEILRDSLHRIVYSTDASAYREVPYGVAYPKDEEEIRALIAIGHDKGLDLIPRAGGTSIAGQVVGKGIVVDISRHMNRILEINSEERWARVQPGVVRDELNLACRQYGLFFSPETSTSNRCCIGGMFGNNSCGSHSLIYGSTRHHVLEAKGILADGSSEHFKEYTVGELEERFGNRFWEKSNADILIERIYAQLINWAMDSTTARHIENTYPDKSLRRRSCGYAIDEVIEGLTDTSIPLQRQSINLCKLLCGSEGTLAFITEIKVDLDPIPQGVKMAICVHCDSLHKSYLANLVCLKHNPDAIELIDGHILELSRQNGSQKANSFFVDGEPAALLVVELSADDNKALEAKADDLERDLTRGDGALAYSCTRVEGTKISKVWDLRKAGLGLLSGMKGDAKPVGVIEDTGVSPERLPDYLSDFDDMLARLALSCVFYGHISTGELHLRPIINMKTKEGVAKFREVAYETALLVKKHRGSLSGEHGDGRLRGEFIPLLYGDETYQLMKEVKQLWDPDGVFNMHKIVDTPPMDEFLRLGVDKSYAISQELCADDTYFNWRAAFDECKVKEASGVSSQTHALMCSVEQCNGAGDCRKSSLFGGVICPAFKVSRDETKTTRARANVLREMLTNGWNSEVFETSPCKGSVFASEEIKTVLDSCLACKACSRECPSNVDMARLRAEILQQRFDKEGIPLRTLLISRLPSLMRLGRPVRPLYNSLISWKPSESMIKGILHFTPERSLPALSKTTMRKGAERLKEVQYQKGNGRTVYLFADEFTDQQEAGIGLKFISLLMNLGYKVEIPEHMESGRTAISKGNLKHAKRCAAYNVDMLSDLINENSPLVGIEPSCILTFRDEYPDLVEPSKRDKAKRLASNCLLYDEFIINEVKAGRISASSFKDDKFEVWLHGHCHQKALVGVEKTAKMLEIPEGAVVHVIPSGCCGMAGSFGYEKDNYKTSLAIGEMTLFPTVRNAFKQSDKDIPVFIAAPGTSCRQQIYDGTGHKAVHPVEILSAMLKNKN